MGELLAEMGSELRLYLGQAAGRDVLQRALGSVGGAARPDRGPSILTRSVLLWSMTVSKNMSCARRQRQYAVGTGLHAGAGGGTYGILHDAPQLGVLLLQQPVELLPLLVGHLGRVRHVRHFEVVRHAAGVASAEYEHAVAVVFVVVVESREA